MLEVGFGCYRWCVDHLNTGPPTSTVDLATVFSNRPVLLFVAAIFGITPKLLIQRLNDPADKTKVTWRVLKVAKAPKIAIAATAAVAAVDSDTHLVRAQ